jgi:hypothetical protein
MLVIGIYFKMERHHTGPQDLAGLRPQAHDARAEQQTSGRKVSANQGKLC